MSVLILGIIAAITIPSLIQKTAQTERISQIKEAYMIIQNATQRAIAEHGFSDDWDYNQAYQYAPKYFIPYVSVQKKCGNGTTSAGLLSKGCFIDNGSNGTWKYLNGDAFTSSGGYSPLWFYTMRLQNGMDVAIWAPAKSNQTQNSCVLFIVDVNGRHGSTTIGRDVFLFSYNLRTGVFSTGAKTSAGIGCINDSQATDCISSGRGDSCARVLQKNGWKYPDNYPINP